MRENWLPTGKPRRCNPATAEVFSRNRERVHRFRRSRSMALWPSGPPAVGYRHSYAGRVKHGGVSMRTRILREESHCSKRGAAKLWLISDRDETAYIQGTKRFVSERIW